MIKFKAFLIMVVMACCACSRAPVRSVANESASRHVGFELCEGADGTLNRHWPVVVLVHGHSFHRGSFATMARMFGEHRVQAVCYNYDYRDRLDAVAGQLHTALGSLKGSMYPVTIVGHSQGGLVARWALTMSEGVDKLPLHVRLVTVASPFGGVGYASSCGMTSIRILSFGVTDAICELAVGSARHDINPSAEFINHPGTLRGNVMTHLKVVTDGDSVFGIDEQRQPDVDGDDRTVERIVKAGHSEIVGQDGYTVPPALVSLLSTAGII